MNANDYFHPTKPISLTNNGERQQTQEMRWLLFAILSLVPGTGIEPVQPKAERFSSHYGFHRRTLPFVRWTMPSPWRNAR